MQKQFLVAAFAAALSVGILSGCTPEAREKYDAAGDSAGKAAAQTGDAVATDAAKTGQAVKEGAEKTGEAVKEGAEATGKAITNAAENTAKVADNGQTTLAVKNAILLSKDLHSSNLNVDTKDKAVILRGSVPTESEKKRAEEIAKGVVGNGYTVTNQLTVGG